MKILYLCTGAPQTLESNTNIFLKHRFDVLSQHFQPEIYSMLPSESGLLRLVRNLLGKSKINLPTNNILNFENFSWHFLPYNQNIFTKFLRKKNPSRLVEIAIKQIENIIDQQKFDLIHAHYGFPFAAVGWHFKQKFSIPYVVTLHGSDIHTDPFKNNHVRKHLLVGLENADKCIFVSEKLLEISKKLGFSAKNAVVNPNGVELASFKPMNKAEIKQELGLSKKTVGFVGSLIPVKRADKFPEIFSRIHENCPETEFLIVGDGSLRTSIETEMKSAKIPVKFAGKVLADDVPKFMNAMDVMILPSRNEGWPCVVLEAQACGTAVVGSDNGGIPEAVGDTNLIVADGENFDNRFADKVCEVLKSEPNSLTLVERASEFSWENLVANELKIYENILRTKNLQKNQGE